MLDKLFNKPDPKSKVIKDTDEDTKVGVSSLRIIAKNTLVFSTVAKELKAINNAFGNYLKLSGIKPAVGEPVSATTKSLADSKEFKMAKVKVQVAGQGEKRQTFVTRIVDKLLNILKLILLGAALSAIIITEKIVDMLAAPVSKIYNAVIDGISNLVTGITKFYLGFNWLDLFVNGFKKFSSFLEEDGFIGKEQTSKIMSDVGSAYKAIISVYGGFLKQVINWIKPKLSIVGRFIGKNILGVDVDKVIEKRNERKRLVEESKKLEEESVNLDKVTKELVTKRDKLKLEKEKKEKELEEKRNAEIKQKAEETYKKRSVFEKIFNRPSKEEKKEEVKPTPPPIEERGKPAVAAPVTPAPAPKAAPAPAAPPPPKASAPAPAPKAAPAPAAPPPPKASAPAPAAKPEPKLDISKVPGSVKPIPQDIKPSKESGASSNNLESLVEKETPKVILQFEPAFENLIVKIAKDFKSAMNQPIQINSGFRTGDYQKDLWFNLKGKNPGYLARVGREGGFDNLTGSKQDAILALMRSGVAAPSKKSGIVIELDKYGEQPGQVVGKKVIPPSAGKGHEAGRAADISTADLENKSFLEKMGFKDTDSYLKSIGLWRSLLKSPAKETWHVETIGGISHTDSVPTPIDKPSTELAAEQRKQSKPNNPAYVNATTTNNTGIETNTTIVQRKAA